MSENSIRQPSAGSAKSKRRHSCCSAEHDPPWHERMCVVIVETVRGARLIRIPETDHVIPIRKSDEFNRVVLGFLGEVL